MTKETNESKESTAAAPEEDAQVETGETGEETAAESGEVSELLKKLDTVTAEVSEQKERYLRTVADLENYRKRALREKEEVRRQANFGLVEDLLPALDNFKLGLKSAENHEGGAVFAEGFRMILSQMDSALKQNGLQEINPESGHFDPNFHEAVSHIPHDEVPEGDIVEVQRIGYKLHDRLIRPAAVVISSGAPAEESSAGEADSMES